MTKKLLMGNEAMAHAALEAGVRVVAGYPGTPSSEIVETVAKLYAAGSAHGVHVEWSTNEKVALELLFGASLAGARGLFTCKQMGLNVASDALMSLNYVSVRGGLVLVVADDPGPISSQTEQDTRRFAAFAKVPVLDPATPEQAFEMIQAAFELSERYHTPVIVRPTTRVDHASAFFDVQDETFAREVPEGGFERDVSKWVIFPRRAFQAHGEINERLGAISQAFSSEKPYCDFNEVRQYPEKTAGGAAFGIVAGGVSSAYALEALRIVEQRAKNAGIEFPPCRFMQVGTPYPFPTEAIGRFAEGLTDILVIEELDYVLEDELARYAGRTHASFTVHGKLTGEARDRGENDVDDIAARIQKFLGLAGRLRLRSLESGQGDAAAPVVYDAADELPVRPPVLCPGCPHRGSFYAIKQALHKTPAVMCGDIGCYTLGNAQPLDAVDTCLCMGAGVTMAQGFSIADPDKKAIAYIGDSTFFASGMTGLANAAYNGHDITVMVLDNATTAMTGSQPHPGTGYTLMGGQNEPLSIEAVLVANGFTHVYHANPLDKDASIIAAKAAIAYEGPSAVIFESPCIQLIKPDEPVSIDAEVCTGCKKCITEIGCPGIGFDPRRNGPRSGDRGQAFIDPSLCNGCDLCVQVCPFKAITFPLPDVGFRGDEDAVYQIVEPVEEGEAVEVGVVGADVTGELYRGGSKIASAFDEDTGEIDIAPMADADDVESENEGEADGELSVAGEGEAEDVVEGARSGYDGGAADESDTAESDYEDEGNADQVDVEDGGDASDAVVAGESDVAADENDGAEDAAESAPASFDDSDDDEWAVDEAALTVRMEPVVIDEPVDEAALTVRMEPIAIDDSAAENAEDADEKVEEPALEAHGDDGWGSNGSSEEEVDEMTDEQEGQDA